MGIFTRFKDIVSANINAMLDRAEDPEKLIKLMVREMEDTLVELKAACAATMADRSRAARELADVQERVDTWSARAELAVQKGRDDLAREALMEKRRHQERADHLEEELTKLDALVEQSQDDIQALEEKLEIAQEKKRLLVQRHIRANSQKRANEDIRRADSQDAILRFEQFEQRIERMEAEAEMSRPRRRSSLEEEFAKLESDGDIEEELKNMKQGTKKSSTSGQGAAGDTKE
ncbi:phage shock protein A [Oceanidesulfovibrio indonesiensis]|uniref:Phage shock protein A n=1 Tax=Oceanidesulfovibrio indonesiensis TaxID=54767 RepID=A0A7M3ME52_9BACT|nr:PspA/IM30 family protein [Oceanidesulfovibrio indonesiensis]TVM16622.1 phage shock protein A [Oceanidesulfovibrio indonesiensis]